MLRELTGLPLDIVASHGDFVNRFLKMTNCEILLDGLFRAQVGVKFEAYDDDFIAALDTRIADAYPRPWRGDDPLAWFAKKGPFRLQVLIHPRQWRCRAKANLMQAGRRVVEGAHYRFGLPCIFS